MKNWICEQIPSDWKIVSTIIIFLIIGVIVHRKFNDVNIDQDPIVVKTVVKQDSVEVAKQLEKRNYQPICQHIVVPSFVFVPAVIPSVSPFMVHQNSRVVVRIRK